MSSPTTTLPTPEPKVSVPAPAPSRPTSNEPRSTTPGRVLACLLCQQRKIKCDRRFPCAHCTRHSVPCVPATQARRRRRRFPERDLLDRVRTYEDLLRRNNVKFEPLHKDEGGSAEGACESDEGHAGAGVAGSSSASTPSQDKSAYEAKNIWLAMRQGLRLANTDGASHNDDGRGPVFANTFCHSHVQDNLLLGTRDTNVHLATLHPQPVHILQLWQTYLDNVDPVLKVTHTPTLQARIIEAASNLGDIGPDLEALMFSIYCMATLSLSPEACEAKFGSSREHLLAGHQFGCRQALINCGFLRTRDRDCLTALHLYLVSVRSSTDPQSLSSMLGVAIRIAQRMGIDDEATTSRYGVLEAEMRRRLWWSLATFDHRISRLAEHTTSVLNPMWDCRVPLNVNDSELREEMGEPPRAQRNATEAIFSVACGELGEFIRHSPSHLEFTNPALKPIAKALPGDGNPAGLLRRMEDEYLRFCDPRVPLHFLTIWMTRSHLCRSRLMHYYARHPRGFEGGDADGDATERDGALLQVFHMLECDTNMSNSPLMTGFRWLLHLYFPFLAYIHIVGELRRRPLGEHARRGWEVMADNFEARFRSMGSPSGSPFAMFTNVVLQAWEVLEEALRARGEPVIAPRIVELILEKLAVVDTHTGISEPPMAMPMGYGLDSYAGMGLGEFSDMPDMANMADMPTHASLSSMAWMWWGVGHGGASWRGSQPG